MSPVNSRRRAVLCTAAAAVLVTAAGTLANPAGATGAAMAGTSGAVAAATGTGADPYSPAFGHPYRRGVMPTRWAAARMHWWSTSHPAPAAAEAVAYRSGTADSGLQYGGGLAGVGVTAGHEKVYLVFWGSQWGRASTNSSGDITLSGDPRDMAPYLQQLFRGLGTGGESWSGVMTQYCDLAPVGAQVCPARSAHVAYPTGGALAGVWVAEGAASPHRADGRQLAAEAVRAAAHFRNITRAANRNAQYVIASPPGTNPDGWRQAGFCAWHDDSGDRSLSGGPASSPHGPVAFTNLPYLTSAGASCGMNFVNSGAAGTLDGVSIVAGHEYAETITDQNPPYGWTDPAGGEAADKCAWIPPGSPGGAADLRLTTGSFAMQSIWSNDGRSSGTCEFSHPVVTTSPTNLLRNGSFARATVKPWVATPGVVGRATRTCPSHSGLWVARLGGSSFRRAGHLAQRVRIPLAWGNASLAFWLDAVGSNRVPAYLTVQVTNDRGRVLGVLHRYYSGRTLRGYHRHSFSLGPFLGQTVIIRFGVRQSRLGRGAAFCLDNASLNVW
jgi:serine protease